MDRIEQYRQIIEKVLTETLAFLKSGNDPGVEYKLLFDRERDSYALLAVGFANKRRIHQFLVHLEIINGKVWLQADNTDFAIARDLERPVSPSAKSCSAFRNPRSDLTPNTPPLEKLSTTMRRYVRV